MLNARIACKNCKLRKHCIAGIFEKGDLDAFDSMVKRGQILQKGKHLFHEGEPFKSLFIIRAGSVKSYLTTSEGEEQVIRFFFPGELLGVSGAGEKHYPVSAQAMENSSVCEIPTAVFEKHSDKFPALKNEMIKVMGRYAREDFHIKVLLSKKTAIQRVASFLVSLSVKLHYNGLSEKNIMLPVSRADMGNYLGMNVETVSRGFSHLQKSGILTVSGRNIKIMDIERLCNLSGSMQAMKFIGGIKQKCAQNKVGHHDTI